MFIELILPVTLLMATVFGFRTLLMKDVRTAEVIPELVVEGTPRKMSRVPLDDSNVIDVSYRTVKKQ
ncbi:MAG: hypothetical protein OCD01_04615 [Fibrobacterales bacterium]